jgi:hypothetical protein
MSAVPKLGSGPRNLRPYTFCNHSGRVDALMTSINLLASWLAAVDTNPNLRDCIVDYAKGRGSITMEELCRNMDSRFRRMAVNQDVIGWRQFMKGIVCKGIQEIQTAYSIVEGSSVTPNRWTTGVVTKLLEATHGQWLYRCIQIHNTNKGTQATLRKEKLQQEIEDQQELGYDGLLEEDQILTEVNLEDLENSSGVRQEYWLTAIRAAREAQLLLGATIQHVPNNTA